MDSDPFTPTLRDGFLYGRGAADMKASLAAFVTAIEALRRRASGRIRAPSRCLSRPTRKARRSTARCASSSGWRRAARRIDYCIVGEPSSVERLGDMIKNGRRGTLSGTLIVKGVQGHVAYPHLARNPIHLAAPAIAELAATDGTTATSTFRRRRGSARTSMPGTGATNVIPGTLELMFNFRYSTASTRESLQQRFEAILARHGLDYELEWTGSGKPFLTPRGTLVDAAMAAIREVDRRHARASCTGGTSDGRFIADICREVVELGPVNATIHKLERARAHRRPRRRCPRSIAASSSGCCAWATR